MPIKDQQVRMRELGRIRMGEKPPGSKFPKKLKTWRLTSRSKKLLDAMAAKYGGEVTRWTNEKAPGEQWQLTTETSILSVIVPVGDVASQWYERWSGDGCVRRCDGEYDTITGKACDCPADLKVRAEKAKKGAACKIHTRVALYLTGCPELGVWRVDSTGKNAADEMAAMAQVCELATKQGRVIPAELRLEQRSSKQPGQARSDYVVPVLDIGVGMDEILEQFGLLDGVTFAPALAAPAPPAALPAARPDLPPDPGFTERAAGPVGEIPPPPVPGPLGADLDDEVAEAEIVDTAEGGSGDAVALSPEAETVAPPVDEWDAERWRAEIRERGVAPRAVIAKARELAAHTVDMTGGDPPTINKADDIVQHPEIAAAVRLWLNL